MKTDKQGNKLIIYNDGFYLKLHNKPEPLKIYTLSGGKIIKYVKKANIMRKPYSCVGFNYHSLLEIQHREIFKDKNIYIRMHNKVYKVNSLNILKKKEFFHYKTEGFELQCFYPMSIIRGLEVDGLGNYLKTVSFCKRDIEKEQECLFK